METTDNKLLSFGGIYPSDLTRQVRMIYAPDATKPKTYSENKRDEIVWRIKERIARRNRWIFRLTSFGIILIGLLLYIPMYDYTRKIFIFPYAYGAFLAVLCIALENKLSSILPQISYEVKFKRNGKEY